MSEASIPPSLVLASGSPRRRELLTEAGYIFTIDPADVDETDYPIGALPSDVAIRLARTKSHTVATRRPNDVVLGADTIVALGDWILGKPQDGDHAKHMLEQLSGTTHIVITGVSVTHRASGFAVEKRVMSAVRMRVLSSADINAYVATNLWQGKAGGYGIQDGDTFVTRQSGCLTNIVGLPMTTTKKLLADAGIVPTKR